MLSAKTGISSKNYQAELMDLLVSHVVVFLTHSPDPSAPLPRLASMEEKLRNTNVLVDSKFVLPINTHCYVSLRITLYKVEVL